jgi:very-short-patch-repair endonuclease
VQAIYEQAVALDRSAARVRIERLRGALDGANREVAELRGRIERATARERDRYRLGAAEHTPSTLGRWLDEHEHELDFIPDRIEPDVNCPLSAAEFEALFRLSLELDPADCVQARRVLPAPGSFPTSADLARVTTELAEVRDRLTVAEQHLADRASLGALGIDGVMALAATVKRAADELEQLEEPWLSRIRDEVRASATFAGSWRDQAKAVREGIDELSTWRDELLGHQVQLPGRGLPAKELIDQLHELRDRFAAGKGVGRVVHRDLSRVREGCRVDGEPPRTAADVELCLTEAQSRRRRYELVNRWNDAVGRIGGPTVTADEPTPEYALDRHVASVAAALEWENGACDALQDRLTAAGFRAPEHPSSGSLRALAAAVRVAGDHFRAEELADWLAAVRNTLERGCHVPNAGAAWWQLVAAFDAPGWASWDEAMAELRRIHTLIGSVAELDRLTARLRLAAPGWAEQILDHRGSGDVGKAVAATQGWEWRQAETWLRDLLSGDDPSTLQRQLETQLRQCSRLTGDLAAASAWLAVAERLTDAERQALTAWAQALKKVGKGTGVYASKWRAVAQSAMEKAQSAVPVWIMPAYRIVESFDPTTAHFKVVIVDESSQCDIFALAALSIADKAVVVGDDKQISPSAVGTDQSAVHELINQHIAGLPHAELLDVTTSLYDIAKRTFPGVIMLREHFRCLPDIIEFSNSLAYNGQILPLRESLPDPTWRSVIDVDIADGYREPGTDTNPPEAEFIVDKIAELCDDPRYDHKTFGVISMLGDAQAELIESKLIDRLGEREMERREIRCGNAYHFQGDERDVMFVSLVVAVGEGRRMGAMTKEADRQRMNVAASRARDQMWCVRTVSVDELHPDDVRARFIRHCANPARVPELMFDLADRCESDFERDVLRHLLDRGYRVKVQHRVGRFRIDLVVEGSSKRLAIELDGDAFHGPDRWESDRNRQAILERLGWRFHRIRGSAYYRDRDVALTSLWERLDAVGIRPGGEDREPVPTTTLIAAAGPAAGRVADDEPAGNRAEAAGTAPPGAPAPPAAVDAHLGRGRFEPLPDATPSDRPDNRSEELDLDEGDLDLDDDALDAPVDASPSSAPPHSPRIDAPEHAAWIGELHAHTPWQSKPLADVYEAPQVAIIDGIVEIVAVEGPVVASRVYELYVRANGGFRVGKNIRSTLNRATAAAVRAGRLEQIEDDEPGQARKTLFLPGTPPVVVRVRGERDLEEIPVSEVAAVARRLLEHDRDLDDASIKRILLSFYDRIRLTTNASAFLDRCLAEARRRDDLRT